MFINFWGMGMGCVWTRYILLRRLVQPRNPKICSMEAHHKSNPWTYLEFKRSTVKVASTINSVGKSVSYLQNGKATNVKLGTQITYKSRDLRSKASKSQGYAVRVIVVGP